MIKIVKSASKVKPQGYCANWVDEPPMNKK
jgi:hypothetical protein